jgi:hypothetical protein
LYVLLNVEQLRFLEGIIYFVAILFDVHMGQEMSAATHIKQTQIIYHVEQL